MDRKWVGIFTTLTLIYSGLAIGITESFLPPIWTELLIRLDAATTTSLSSFLLMGSYFVAKISNNVFGRIYSRLDREYLAPVIFAIIPATLLSIPGTTSLLQFGILVLITTIFYGGFYAAGVLWITDIHGSRSSPLLHAENLLRFWGRTLPPLLFSIPYLFPDTRDTASPPNVKYNISQSTGKNVELKEEDNFSIDPWQNRTPEEQHQTDFFTVTNHCAILTSFIILAAFLHFVNLIYSKCTMVASKIDSEDFEIEPPLPVTLFILGVVIFGTTISWVRNTEEFLPETLQSSNFQIRGSELWKVLAVNVGVSSGANILNIFISRKIKPEWMLIGNVTFVCFGTGLTFLLDASRLHYDEHSKVLVYLSTTVLRVGVASGMPSAFGYVLSHVKMSPFTGALFYSASGVFALIFHMVVRHYRRIPNLRYRMLYYCNGASSLICLFALSLFILRLKVRHKKRLKSLQMYM